MQTVSYTAKVRVRRPEAKVVDINDYRRKIEQVQEADAAPAPALHPKAARRRKLRRQMELLCVLLEVGVSTSLLVLLVTATARFLFL